MLRWSICDRPLWLQHPEQPEDGPTAQVAIVHDHIVQAGGAERVLLLMSRAFPDAVVHTAFFEPERTFPEFASVPVRPLPIDKVAVLRHHHRLALPFMAPSFASLRLDADIVLCSSAGWSHGTHAPHRKVVYWYTTAPWLHTGGRPYLAGLGLAARAAVRVLGPPLRRWDRRGALEADRHIADSTWIASLVREAYGVDVDVLLPPSAFQVSGPEEELPGMQSGSWLTVGRLVTHKNIDVAVAAFAELPDQQLTVLGDGPQFDALVAAAPPNVNIAGRVSDAQLRWAYRRCAGVVTVAHEDFGLTPLEVGMFGRPTVALRWGGFVDTVVEGVNGLFVEHLDPGSVAATIRRANAESWDAQAITALAARFDVSTFIEQLRVLVTETA